MAFSYSGGSSLSSPYYSQYSNHTVSVEIDGRLFALRDAQISITHDVDGGRHIDITGRTASQDIRDEPIRRYYLNERKHNVYPGSLTIEDANGNALTISPTGRGGYTVLTGSTPVRVNSKMNETIREHTARCLSYVKPTPPAELES